MAVSYKGIPELLPIKGVRLAATSAGIYKSVRNDLVLFELSDTCNVAATFTRNHFCAAPVVVARDYLVKSCPRYLLINAGNANAGTGKEGIRNTESCCRSVADIAGCIPEEVLPFSTGVIGTQLPAEKICAAIPDLVDNLDESNWVAAAEAIMTTDTVPKGVSRAVHLTDGVVTITGIAKGSGMIRPDMATMLAYVATDAAVPQDNLQDILKSAVNHSFNRITVDGDTSTNDACVLIASGSSGMNLTPDSNDLSIFREAVTEVLTELAQQIIKDGEGATKFVSIEVVSGRSEQECNLVAYTIAHSPLVKTALFASDPNWGRILAAVGRAGIDDLDLEKLNIYLGEVCIVRGGEPDPDYSEKSGQQALSPDEIVIRIELGRGDATTTVWTCDLSYDYVRINAEYRT